MKSESFASRHIGPNNSDTEEMLRVIGCSTLDELINETIPAEIRLNQAIDLPEPVSENDFIKHISKLAFKNKIFKNFIGNGYYGTILPGVIKRNILENPSWYTSYTPYQAEISQGRLEALLNFQTLIMDLTGMKLANASLLDEGTAASEAMIMMFNARQKSLVNSEAKHFFVDEDIFAQTKAVIETRAKPLGIEIIYGDYKTFSFYDNIFGAIAQFPTASGEIRDYRKFAEKTHENGKLLAIIADIISLAILTPPGEWGADVVVGSTQRFGIPLGYGGPHAAYFATREEFKRFIPGRIIGVTKDVQGHRALRLALQTREQHIKRERATSNICTAQALLATMASMYAVYHGPEGLKRIAGNIHQAAATLAEGLMKFGFELVHTDFFDTIQVIIPEKCEHKLLKRLAISSRFNFHYISKTLIGISTDELTTYDDVSDILEIFAKSIKRRHKVTGVLYNGLHFNEVFQRTSPILTDKVFNSYHSETEMMRYMKKLERKDFSLTHSMISLGSCTMKLNAASEMFPLSWPEFSEIHPFAPKDQAKGYLRIIKNLENYLASITGFKAVSLQPNSGAAGEYAGLLVIRAYHESRNEGHRNIVLIPSSAHGTNPASAVMAGYKVIVIECDEKGNVSITDLYKKTEQYREQLAALMITYPSTHGVFETNIIEICKIIHDNGGQIYLDGANMNAQVGLTNPATIGADVCHLNLHKTFAIPHGGGGPGVGPIAVAQHLAPFLPTHPFVETGGKQGINPVSSAPFGSASVLVITYAYIRMLGEKGLSLSTKYAILNANYIATRLKDYYHILYTGATGRVAHEMILDCHNFKSEADITEADIAKRLMDYGFHAPTLSFPVHGTLMVEPTESESKAELDRFIECMISIHNEIMEIKNGIADKTDNVLKNAPHTSLAIASDDWQHSYGRQKAAYPLSWIIENKFFPAVSRVDDAFGDRNLVCSCTPLNQY
jgi:glycine dehydrogenase